MKQIYRIDKKILQMLNKIDDAAADEMMLTYRGELEVLQEVVTESYLIENGFSRKEVGEYMDYMFSEEDDGGRVPEKFSEITDMIGSDEFGKYFLDKTNILNKKYYDDKVGTLSQEEKDAINAYLKEQDAKENEEVEMLKEKLQKLQEGKIEDIKAEVSSEQTKPVEEQLASVDQQATSSQPAQTEQQVQTPQQTEAAPQQQDNTPIKPVDSYP